MHHVWSRTTVPGRTLTVWGFPGSLDQFQHLGRSSCPMEFLRDMDWASSTIYLTPLCPHAPRRMSNGFSLEFKLERVDG
ncbi:hypothetical protein BASA61_001844 [Batrachochytrium salamandrivorans]|nr:hypothetical protein BASA61_001844 [Batrachochytrium salamandrivorans]